ncbi:hypothetical protein BJV82DRAFT_705203 [Fennellomyces sp. T-0311]|nr:hypothetical protein BJV82DRAFT_705203 [Fennellomyces sp. T-0311]
MSLSLGRRLSKESTNPLTNSPESKNLRLTTTMVPKKRLKCMGAIESDTIVSGYANLTIPGSNTSDSTISDPTDLDSMNPKSISTGLIIPESINIDPAVPDFTNTDPTISDSGKTNSGIFIHIPPIYLHKKKQQKKIIEDSLELKIAPNSDSSCFIDCIMETLWFSVFPFVKLDEIADLGPPKPYNLTDIMLVLSTVSHSQNTYQGRKEASKIARHFAWCDLTYAGKQMNSPVHFFNDFILSKASPLIQQLFFRSVTRTYICNVCGNTFSEDAIISSIDHCDEMLTTDDPSAFTTQFAYFTLSSPRHVNCRSETCSNTQATSCETVTRYSPFLIVEPHSWTNDQTKRIESSHFLYKLQFQNAQYTKCAQIYGTSHRGDHFYTVATILHGGKQVLGKVDNLAKSKEIEVLSADPEEFDKLLTTTNLTVLVWYKLDSIELVQKPKRIVHENGIELSEILQPTGAVTQGTRNNSVDATTLKRYASLLWKSDHTHLYLIFKFLEEGSRN